MHLQHVFFLFAILQGLRPPGEHVLLQLSDQPHGVITMTKAVRAAINIQDFVAASLRDAFQLTTNRAATVLANQPWAGDASAIKEKDKDKEEETISKVTMAI